MNTLRDWINQFDRLPLVACRQRYRETAMGMAERRIGPTAASRKFICNILSSSIIDLQIDDKGRFWIRDAAFEGNLAYAARHDLRHYFRLDAMPVTLLSTDADKRLAIFRNQFTAWFRRFTTEDSRLPLPIFILKILRQNNFRLHLLENAFLYGKAAGQRTNRHPRHTNLPIFFEIKR